MGLHNFWRQHRPRTWSPLQQDPSPRQAFGGFPDPEHLHGLGWQAHQNGPQWQHGPQTPTWLQAAAQITDNCRPSAALEPWTRHGPRWQCRPIHYRDIRRLFRPRQYAVSPPLTPGGSVACAAQSTEVCTAVEDNKTGHIFF